MATFNEMKMVARKKTIFNRATSTIKNIDYKIASSKAMYKKLLAKLKMLQLARCAPYQQSTSEPRIN